MPEEQAEQARKEAEEQAAVLKQENIMLKEEVESLKAQLENRDKVQSMETVGELSAEDEEISASE